MLNIVRYLKTSSSNNNKTPHTKGGLVDEEAKQLELSDAAGGGDKRKPLPWQTARDFYKRAPSR